MIKINPQAERLYSVFCSWCGCFLYYSERKNSHGMCKPCKKAQLENWTPSTVLQQTLHHGPDRPVEPNREKC
jgi:hypothetical protein